MSDLRLPLSTVLREWGRIGITGFGGPPAHIALLRRLCVEERGWLTDEDFEAAISACNLLPGPASTQLAIYCAWRCRRPTRSARRRRSASCCPRLVIDPRARRSCFSPAIAAARDRRRRRRRRALRSPRSPSTPGAGCCAELEASARSARGARARWIVYALVGAARRALDRPVAGARAARLRRASSSR